MKNTRHRLTSWAHAGLAATIVLGGNAAASAQDKQPNIVVIWGDDIGWNNPSCYNSGMMGYKTPNHP